MSGPCPNKNVDEWKRMVKHLGSEDEAYRAYIAHGFTIPNAISMSDLKKQIGLVKGPYSSTRQVNINRNIGRFNKENGTSHRVKYTPVTPTSYKAELIFNYLPVNKVAQQERNKRRNGESYIGVEDGESFENIHDPEKEPFTPSESEAEAGQWKDGDFLTPLYLPSGQARRGPRYQRYIASKEQDLKALYTNKDKLINSLKKVDDKALKQRIVRNLGIVNAAIEKTKEKIKVLATQNNLDRIGEYAEQDMATLEAIFTTPIENLQISDLHVARRIIDIWTMAGDFSGNNSHIFYTPMELKHAFEGLKDITDKFTEWQKRAEGYNQKLIQMQEDIIRGKIQDVFGEADIDFDEALPDINFFTKELLDISEINYVLFQAIHKWVKDANWAAQTEVDERNNVLKDLIEKTGLPNFDIFQQTFSNTDRRKTGEMVHRWSQTWFKEERKFKDRLRIDMERAFSMENEKAAQKIRLDANRNFIANMGKRAITFDPNILFWKENLSGRPAPTEDEKQAHIKELKDLLGEKAYEKYYKLAEGKVERYEEDLESAEDRFKAEYYDFGIATFHTNTWIARNSPFFHSYALKKGFDGEDVDHKGLKPYMDDNRDTTYMVYIPRKKSPKGQQTNYYDNNFTQIEENESYLNLYDHMFDLLQELKMYLPYGKINFMNPNSIPFIKKKVVENMTGSTGSLSKGFSRSREKILESVRMEDLSTITDPEERKEFQFEMLINNRSRINAYIELKTAQYMTDNNDERPNEDTVENWRREIMDEIAEEKSFDLERIMKAFTSMAITYKHRSSIEDQMRIAEDIVSRAKEKKENPAGEPMTDKHDNLSTKKDKNLEYMSKMLNDFMDTVFWGYPSNKPEGKTSKKILTKAEKLTLQELEKAEGQLEDLWERKQINNAEYTTRSAVIKDQIAVIGGVAVRSKFGDNILKYVQLKGMGWNGFAAIANIGFGVLSNTIEASDGRNYSMKSYRKAFALTFNSVGRNFTFNQWNGISGNAKKIRVLMNYYDTLKTSKDELYKTSTKSLFKWIGGRLEWANPYSPQTRSEYFNQAPVMIAILMETMVTIGEGENKKEISLWDAYELDSEKKLKLKEGVDFKRQGKLDMDTKTIIDKLVKMNHGNYDPDSKISAKRKLLGRALSQFRTWAFQGFQERFGGIVKDYQLVDRKTGKKYIIRKGRYKSYGAFYQHNNNLFGIGATLMLLRELSLKLLWQGTTFDKMVGEKFTTTDAANMRKNMTELVFQLALIGFGLVLRAALYDEDDKDKRKTLALNFLINQGARISTDIMFYTNPIEFERLARNAIPAFSLVVDAAKFADSAAGWLSGDEDILQSGPNKGESRTLRDLSKMIPLVAQRQRLKSSTRQVYKK